VFYYQRELTQEQKDKGHRQPENVIGSYAVYHASRGGVHRGQVDAEKYKVGKAFHIYRPEAIDAKGNRVWCELKIDIENQMAAITVPPKWLDGAFYPVLVDPTFGYTSVGANYWPPPYGTILTHGDTYTGVSATGKSMSVYAQGYNEATVLQAALYNGTSLVSNGYTDDIDVVSGTPQWLTGNFVSGPALSTDEYYLCLNTQDQVEFYYDDAGTNDAKYATQAYDTWPSSVTWSVDPDGRAKFSIYCTYGVTEAASAVCASTTAASGSGKVVRKINSATSLVSALSAIIKRSIPVDSDMDSISTIATKASLIKRLGAAIASGFDLAGNLTSSAALYVYVAAINESISSMSGKVIKIFILSSAINAMSNITSGARVAWSASGIDDSVTSILGNIQKSTLVNTSINSVSAVVSAMQKITAIQAASSFVSTVVGLVHRTMGVAGTNIAGTSWVAGWLHGADNPMQAFYEFYDTYIKRSFAISRTLKFYDN